MLSHQMMIFFWVFAPCTGKMFQYFDMQKETNHYTMQKPKIIQSLYSFLLGFCTVYWSNVPVVRNVRESNHYTVQKPKRRPSSDQQPPWKPKKLIHASSCYKIGKHFEVEEDNWKGTVAAEVVLPAPESQLQLNTSVFIDSVFSKSRHISWGLLL
jgi:hypothetical protein